MEKLGALLTTKDNPYNPFTHWYEWLQYDTIMGYHTCARLDKATFTSDALTEEENLLAIEEGNNELIRYGAINKQGKKVDYIKVYK